LVCEAASTRKTALHTKKLQRTKYVWGVLWKWPAGGAEPRSQEGEGTRSNPLTARGPPAPMQPTSSHSRGDARFTVCVRSIQ